MNFLIINLPAKLAWQALARQTHIAVLFILIAVG
jgi:hypothetical protein